MGLGEIGSAQRIMIGPCEPMPETHNNRAGNCKTGPSVSLRPRYMLNEALWQGP